MVKVKDAKRCQPVQSYMAMSYYINVQKTDINNNWELIYMHNVSNVNGDRVTDRQAVSHRQTDSHMMTIPLGQGVQIWN